MGNKKRLGVLLATLALAQGAIYVLPRAESAIPVIDTANINQTNLVYAQALKTALNTATQIANQVRNLQSASPDLLSANSTGINEQLAAVLSTVQASNGIMRPGETATQSWDKVFNSATDYGVGSSTTRAAYQQNMLYYLDETYKDSLRVAKTNQQIEADMSNLNRMLTESQNVEGNKSAIQVQTAVQAQGVKQQMQLNQTMAALLSQQAAQANYERSIDNATYLESQRISAKINEEISGTTYLPDLKGGR